jgi:hypothetical protein
MIYSFWACAVSLRSARDTPEGYALLADMGAMPGGLPMLMDRVYEGARTRQPVPNLGMIPMSRQNLIASTCGSMTGLYKMRNEIKRFFWRLKGFQESSPASGNSTSSSSALHSSSKLSDSVNTL